MSNFKKIGIIGAMDEEIDPLIEEELVTEIVETPVVKFYINDRFVVARCGIGKVNAASCTQAMIDNFGVDVIINTGIAGAIGEGIAIGDIVVATDLIEHDFDATGVGLDKGVIPRMETSVFRCDESLVECARVACGKVLTKETFHIGRIVSGDEFVSKSERKAYLKNTFNALAAEMEGAAIAHVCYLNKIPFLVIRAMSDNASENANNEYEENDLASIDKTSQVLLEMVGSF
jgi:adenosylhomocysteine nucleosidase